MGNRCVYISAIIALLLMVNPTVLRAETGPELGLPSVAVYLRDLLATPVDFSEDETEPDGGMPEQSVALSQEEDLCNPFSEGDSLPGISPVDKVAGEPAEKALDSEPSLETPDGIIQDQSVEVSEQEILQDTPSVDEPDEEPLEISPQEISTEEPQESTPINEPVDEGGAEIPEGTSTAENAEGAPEKDPSQLEQSNCSIPLEQVEIEQEYAIKLRSIISEYEEDMSHLTELESLDGTIVAALQENYDQGFYRVLGDYISELKKGGYPTDQALLEKELYESVKQKYY